MRWSLLLCTGLAVLVRPCPANADDDTTPQSPAAAASTPAAPVGRAENRWRYRFANGRWWYMAEDNRWSYYDGRQWVAAQSRSSYFDQRVDPALLRLEAKEGSLGAKKWKRVPGGAPGGLPISGTQGSAGGNPGGSFTDPGGMPSAVNTTTGEYYGFGTSKIAPLAPPPGARGRR